MTKAKPKPKSQPAAPVPAPPRTTRAFVDGLEAGVVRLLMEDEHGEWQIFHLPAGALPAEAKEGSWIEIGVRSIPSPDVDPRVLREQLGRSDLGRNFSL